MTRILNMSASVSLGHVTPMLGVVESLTRRGVEVGWLSLPQPLGPYEDMVRKAGAQVLETPLIVTKGEESPADMAGIMGKVESAAVFVRKTFIDSVSPYVEPVREAIRKFAPDIVTVDSMCYSGMIAAQKEGVPLVSMSMGLQILTPTTFESSHSALWKAVAPARAQLFLDHGAEFSFKHNACLSPTLNVVFASEAFVGSKVDAPANTAMVGPALHVADATDAEFPWDRVRDDRPLVYISVGTVMSDPALYELTAQAVASLGAQAIISAAGVDPTSLDLPADAIFVRSAPQQALLKKVNAFITHGGANSVTEALYFGVPMLVIPLGMDQPLNAHFVAAARSGIAMSRDQLTPQSCRDAIAELLAPSNEYRANAARIGEAYHAANGAESAAERILMLTKGR